MISKRAKRCGRYFIVASAQISTLKEVMTKIPGVLTANILNTIASSKNAAIKIFWIKLLPASVRPICSSDVKNWIFAFNGTMKTPPLKPNKNDASVINAALEPCANISNEAKSPSAPKGTMPISMWFFE